VLFYCLGNICRSPLAQGIFEAKVAQAGLQGAFVVDSAGTGAWHRGEPPDPGSVAVARKHGLDLSGQRARQVVAEDLDRFDVLVAMDANNRAHVLRMAETLGKREALRGRIWLARNFERDPDGAGLDLDVPDPWGEGPRAFEEVYQILDRACQNLLQHLIQSRKPNTLTHNP
jgi:protein-tyrosine phosphatase